MEKTPVSIIVVLYYSSHLLKTLIKNISETIPEADEILLIDNSGEDLSRFRSKSVTIIHTPRNIGYGAAINVGVKNAKNQNIIAMNPDLCIKKFNFNFSTFPDEKYIIGGKPVEWSHDRHFPSLIFDFLRFAFFNLSRQFKWVYNLTRKTNIENRKDLLIADWISGAFIVTNQRTMDAIGGFDENFFLFYEEIDLCKRAAICGINVYLSPDIKFELNQGTASATDVSEIKLISEIKSSKRFHNKYSGRFMTPVMFFGLKIFSFGAGSLLGLLALIFHNKKMQKKARQYKIYARTI